MRIKEFATLRPPKVSGINEQDLDIQRLRQIAICEEVQFSGIPVKTFESLARIVKEIIPYRLQPREYRELDLSNFEDGKIKPVTIPTLVDYTATIAEPLFEITNKRNDSDIHPKKIAFFFEPGAQGSHASNTVILKEVTEEVKKRDLDFDISLLVAFSSSVSLDTLMSFSSSPVTRIVSLAAMQQQILYDHPEVDEVYIFSHSLAGPEAIYKLQILSELMKQNQTKTEIGASILVEPSGQYKQSAISFVFWKSPLFALHYSEMAELYPSPEEVRNAELNKNVPKLQRLNQRRDNPPYLSSFQKDILHSIDVSIEAALTNKDHLVLRRLRKERRNFLLPIIASIQDKGEVRKPNVKIWTELMWKALIAGIPLNVRSLPEELREQTQGVIVRLWGENDIYFPAAVAAGRRASYPNAKVIEQTIFEASHLHPNINAPEFSKTALDLITKLRAISLL